MQDDKPAVLVGSQAYYQSLDSRNQPGYTSAGENLDIKAGLQTAAMNKDLVLLQHHNTTNLLLQSEKNSPRMMSSCAKNDPYMTAADLLKQAVTDLNKSIDRQTIWQPRISGSRLAN